MNDVRNAPLTAALTRSPSAVRRVVRGASVLVVVLGVSACASSSGARPAAGAESGTTAGRTSDAAAIASAIDVVGAPFVASKKSRKYYPASCHTVKLIKPADQLGFASQKDAEAAGFAKDLYSTDCQY